MAPGDAGAGRSRCGDRAHDVTRNGHDLAVEADLDRLFHTYL